MLPLPRCLISLRRAHAVAVLALLTACAGPAAVTPPTTQDAADTVAPQDTGSDATPKDATTADAALDAVAADGAAADAVDAATPDVPDAAEDASDAVTDALADTDDAAVAPDVVADTPDAAEDSAGGEDTGPIVKATYSLACTTTADCQIPCAGGPCLSGKCSLKPKGKSGCLLELGGDQVMCLPAGAAGDAAACLVCNPAVVQTSLTSIGVAMTVDGPADGLTLVDTAKNGISWSFNDKRFVSGGKSLYFGDPANHSYGNGKAVAGSATLPAMSVPAISGASPRIGFWLWLDTEESIGRDLLTVSVLDGDAATAAWTSDAIKGTTKKNVGQPAVWKRIDFDASAWAGKSVQLVFAFDTKDSFINGFEGAYVDDITIDTGCCAGPADCEDGNACTTDSCGGAASAPVCSHALKADCCDSASDCDDKLVCTLDLCPTAGGACTHAALPGCCTATADCDDANECTNDGCNGNVCTHADTCCKADGDCKPTNACDIGQCIGGSCAFTSLCCIGDGDCDDFNTCTKDACVTGKCLHNPSASPGCCTPVVLNAAFAGSEEGWSAGTALNGADWHYKTWSSAKSAPGVLHFGDPSKNLALPQTTKTFKVATASPQLSLIAGKETQLSFQLWGDVGGGGAVAVRVYTNVDGLDVTLNTLSGSQISGSWHLFNIDLTPVAGKSLQIFFEATITSYGFGTITGQGVFLDDVMVTSTCLPKKCANTAGCAAGPFTCLAGTCSDGLCLYSNGCCKTNDECDDKSLCTTDKCTNGKCVFSAISGCCMGDGDCNDSNACTTNVCGGPGKQCAYVPIAACCLAAKDCDDKNTCTTDTCVLNKCINQNFCCAADKDCDDGETKCTTDTCVNKVCAHKATGAAGCCIPDVWSNAFDAGDLKDIKATNSAGASKGWQLWNSASVTHSPPGTLYYGDPAKGNFDFNGVSSNGSATTPKITLPVGTPSSVDLWLYMDTESGTYYDQLTISTLIDGAKKSIFTKSASGFSTKVWFNLKADLSAYQGKDVQLVFDFNTMDGAANSGKGVFIDDLKITTKCD